MLAKAAGFPRDACVLPTFSVCFSLEGHQLCPKSGHPQEGVRRMGQMCEGESPQIQPESASQSPCLTKSGATGTRYARDWTSLGATEAV